MDRVGAYTWRPRTDTWTWNEAMFLLLGYAPHAVRPSRSLVVAHKHPDDRAHVERVMADAVAHRLAYTMRHRIVTMSGEVEEVVAVGRPVNPGGDLVLRGFLVPVRRPGERDGGPADDGPVAASTVGGPAAALPGAGEPQWVGARVEHDRHLARALDVLSGTLELPLGAAASLLSHLANTHAMPPILVAERVIVASLDPDLEGIGGLLTGIEPDAEEPTG